MPHNNWLYQTRDIKFQIKEWLPMEKLLSTDDYKDYYGIDDFDAILDVNVKICRDVICPANKEADEIGMKFVGGNEHAVVSPPSYQNVYDTVMDAGLGPHFGDRSAEGKMPLAWYAPILELQCGASPAIPMFWCLTQGATTIIQFNSNDYQKNLYLPKMYTGEWSGTMCLTEPGAGSEVGAVSTKAFETDTPGLYKIKGQKCFITSGDHDMSKNIIHPVLAKTEGAKPGTAGISLFLVPKWWVNDDGSMGEWNDVTTVGIEHKMGLHGSATATLAFGENNNCKGWLIGDAPVDGRGKGMSYMFQMMNEERLNTGLFSLSAIGAAYYSALDYTKMRVQSPHSTNPKGPSVRIIEHEDVRRMLLFQKSVMEAIRALIYSTYLQVDFSHDLPDAEARQEAEDIFMIQNPMCKAYSSDMAWICTEQAIQCLGGYGFMEEYAPASLARDCKIYSLWEGTNFIQANDLVGRKFSMGKGEPFKKWLAVIGDFIASKKDPAFAAEFAMMEDAFAAYNEILAINAGFTNKQLTLIYATRILHSTAKILCGKLMLEQGIIAAAKLAELGADHFDAPFYRGKIASVKFYVNNIVPDVFGVLKAIKAQDTCMIDMAEEELM